MNHFTQTEPMRPVAAGERLVALDVLRGAALFGVLLVNLLTLFRVSLFAHILSFHTHAGWMNRATNIVLAWAFEFKAFTLFSFLFGVGVGVQAERVERRQQGVVRFLVRRFAVLLGIGLAHLLLIWNGDILTLYAVCGLLLVPFVKLPAKWLAACGLAVIVIAPFLPFFNNLFPTAAAMRSQAEVATRVYATGSFAQLLALRWAETKDFIAPLLISSLPRTFGLMLCGVAVWRSGMLQRLTAHRGRLLFLIALTGTLGALTTTAEVWARETGRPQPSAFNYLYPHSMVLMAFAYGAGLWLHSAQAERWARLVRLFAAAGQMALSNYLAQSLIFSVLFYGFGFGLFGKLGSASAALLGFAVFAAQLAASAWWLRRFRFGPVEWLWRSLTYGRRQRLRAAGTEVGDPLST